MSGFEENKPKTGSGKASPPGTRMVKKVDVTFRDNKGKEITTPEKPKETKKYTPRDLRK